MHKRTHGYQMDPMKMTRSSSVLHGLLLCALLCSLGAVCAAVEAPAVDTTPEDPENPAFAPIQEDPQLPRVLLIGDSISIGYTLPVRELLKGKANLLRIPVNGGPTARGMQMLDAWLGGQQWDVIHFNWGLHDIKRMKARKVDISGEWQVAPEIYRRNLDGLVRKLKNTGAKLIWAATTPVPEGTGSRVAGDEVKANAIAAAVMQEHGVPINNLHAYVLPHLEHYQRPKNVHFTDAGSAFLGKKVAEVIGSALEAKERQ